MSLNLKDLVAQGAFISAKEPTVKREISWHNTEGVGQKADVWVRLASYHTVTNTWKAAEGNQEHLAARIATMVCDEEGAPIFTTGDILGTADPSRGPICDTLFLALITAVNEANSAKTSPPEDFWFEIVLHGVGGRTIAEAQQTLSMVEARQWAAYIKRHGGLNVAERVEQSAALICSTAAQLMGNKRSKITDFIPNREGDDELKLATPQDFMRVLQGARKG